MRTNEGGLFISRRVSYHHHVLAKTQKQRRECKNFIVEKRGGFRYSLIRVHWHGEAEGGLIRRGAFYVTV